MRIVIVGAGALGGFAGAILTEGGGNVTLVGNNPVRIKQLREDGLYIAEGIQGERCVQLNAVDNCRGMPPADLLFVAVKNYQTQAALQTVAPLIAGHTHIITVQNGLGNKEELLKFVDEDHLLVGLTYHSIQHVGPNRLRYRKGIKPIQVAPVSGKITPDIEHIANSFTRMGLDTKIVAEIEHAIWGKLLHNAVINPVTAITGLTCQELEKDEDLLPFLRQLTDEILAVMEARGMPVPETPEARFDPILGSMRALGKNRPSMWQDLRRGRLTEVDAINGAIVAEAKRLGLEAPLNFGLVSFIHSRERWTIKRLEQSRATLADAKAHMAALGAGPLPGRIARPMAPAPGAGMPSESRIPLETAPKLRELRRKYYQDLHAADRDPKRRIAWVTGLAPIEILRAFDLDLYFPENHAALIGASRRTDEYIPRAMAEGFSQFISSEMACDIGAFLKGDSPLMNAFGVPGPPHPNLITYSTNNGRELMHWFEYYGRLFQVPVIGLHPPRALHIIDRLEVDMAAQQLLRMVSRLESITVRKLDVDKLATVVDCSARAARLWADILDLAQQVPSPITYFDLLIHMAPMVLMRGTEACIEYYHILKAELEDRVARGIAAVPGEKYRLYWEGPPIWGAIKPLAKLCFDNQVAVTGATFCHLFALKDLDRNNPIESLAAAYLDIFPNRSESYKATWLMQQFENHAIDGVVYHEGRTNGDHSNVRYGLEHRIKRASGLPSIILDADSHDMRLFSMDHIRRQLIDFMELMDLHHH